VRSVGAYASGKLYLEHSFTTAFSIGANTIGLALAAFPITTDVLMGADANSLSYFTSGQVFINNVQIATIQTSVLNDTICMAVDRTNNLIWFRTNAGNWNNSATANPATGAGGISLSTLNAGAIFAATGLNTNADVATSNFGLSAFAQAVPAGFSPWDAFDMGSRGILCLQ
jgi:hypothetical protein